MRLGPGLSGNGIDMCQIIGIFAIENKCQLNDNEVCTYMMNLTQ